MREQAEQKAKEEAENKAREDAKFQPKNPSIRGVELTSEQWQTLQESGFVYLENMMQKDNSGKFSAYIFLNEEKDKVFFSSKNPDDFIKYGKYEMRIRDKILVENGFIAKTKVKWYGGGFAYPFLWKTDKADTEYKESFSDPRLPKEEKTEARKQIVIPKLKKGRGRGM